MKIFIPKKTTVEAVYSPPSKSIAQRVIWATALSNSTTKIINVGNSDDVQHLINGLKSIGVNVEGDDKALEITGIKSTDKENLFLGESGLAVRLSTFLMSAFTNNYTINGAGSILNRKMSAFTTILQQLGLQSNLNGDKLPIQVSGSSRSGTFNVDGSVGSQYLSGLLMLLPTLEGDSIVNVKDLKSKPYIDLTLQVLSDFGIKIEHYDYSKFTIKGNQTYHAPNSIKIESDYSSAANWVVYGALNNGLIIKGLNEFSKQGDREILSALRDAGGAYSWKENGLHIHPAELIPFTFDANDCPDLFPALVVLAASGKGISTIYGVQRLANKESDRGIVLQEEFGKLGLKIELDGDNMHIHGIGKLQDGLLNSHHDHRIVMAGAIAASLAVNGIEIDNAEAINKSDPTFLSNFDLQS